MDFAVGIQLRGRQLLPDPKDNLCSVSEFFAVSFLLFREFFMKSVKNSLRPGIDLRELRGVGNAGASSIVGSGTENWLRMPCW